MKIKKIHINNVLSYDNEIIEFNDNLNIFVGANGSGKSNLVNIIIYLIKRYCFKNYDIANTHGPDMVELKRYIIRQKNPLYNSTEDAFLQKHKNKENEPTLIDLSIIFEENDIHNLNEIKSKKEIICEFLDKFVDNISLLEDRFQIDKNDVKKIFEIEDSDLRIGEELIIKIREKENSFTVENNYEKYYNYMNYFSLILELLSLMNVEHNINNPFVFFEAYRNNSSETTKAGITEFNNNQGYINLHSWKNVLALNNSIGSNSTYIMLATKKFGKAMRCSIEEDDGRKKFYNSEDYLKLRCFLEKFGYDINLECMNPLNNIYQFYLIKDGLKTTIDSISSGEREIINFIFGLFLEKLNDGIIIIDEPELHLHPGWQKKLIRIIKEETGNKNIQIFFVTHSSSFISYDVLNSVYRIYKEHVFSKCIKINDLLQENENAFRKQLSVINATNNEKIFFANSVILVEGITDEILFKKIYESEIGKIPDGVEFVNISGKENLNNFKNVLDKLKILYFYIGDYDNLYKKEELNQFFCVDIKAQVKDLNKKAISYDGQNLLKVIEELLNNNNEISFNKLKNIYDLYNKKFWKNKPNLTAEERKTINDYITEKYKDNIYYLKNGEIEDYLGTGSSKKTAGFNKVISFLNDDKKYNEFKSSNGFAELKAIIEDIDFKIKKYII